MRPDEAEGEREMRNLWQQVLSLLGLGGPPGSEEIGRQFHRNLRREVSVQVHREFALLRADIKGDVQALRDSLAGLPSRVGKLERALDGLPGQVRSDRDAVSALRGVVDQIEATVSDLTGNHTALASRLTALESHVGEIDRTLDSARSRLTEQRDLPTEDDMAIFDVAQRYSAFVEEIAVEAADAIVDISVAARNEGTDPAVVEAGLARMVIGALLLDDPADLADLDRLARERRRPPPELKVAREKADDLRQRVADRGAEFGATAFDVKTTEELRLFGACRPGRVEFIVAPSLLVDGRIVTDQGGRRAGPWVLTANLPS